jgi:hypothetical protein
MTRALLGYLLLEEDGTETRVESTDTLVLEDLGETAHETAGEFGLRDKTDTGSFQRAEGNVGEEFSGSGRGEVDGSAVLGGRLVTELVDPLLLEELVTTELESTLEEVTGSGRTETGKESASTLVGNDLAEATDHTTVVCDGVKLDSGLDAVRREEAACQRTIQCRGGGSSGKARIRTAERNKRNESDLHIDGSESTVGDGAADSTSEGESGVELKPRELGSRGSSGSIDLSGHCERCM